MFLNSRDSNQLQFYMFSIHFIRQLFASVAQPAERVLGKDEVASSNLA